MSPPGNSSTIDAAENGHALVGWPPRRSAASVPAPKRAATAPGRRHGQSPSGHRDGPQPPASAEATPATAPPASCANSAGRVRYGSDEPARYRFPELARSSSLQAALALPLLQPDSPGGRCLSPWESHKLQAQLSSGSREQSTIKPMADRVARAAEAIHSAHALADCLVQHYVQAGGPLRLALEHYYGGNKSEAEYEISRVIEGLRQIRGSRHLMGGQLRQVSVLQPRNNPLYSLFVNAIAPATQVDALFVHFPGKETERFRPILDAFAHAVERVAARQRELPPVLAPPKRPRAWLGFKVRGTPTGGLRERGPTMHLSFPCRGERPSRGAASSSWAERKKTAVVAIEKLFGRSPPSAPDDRPTAQSHDAERRLKLKGFSEICWSFGEAGGEGAGSRASHAAFLERHGPSSEMVVHTGHAKGANSIREKYALKVLLNGSGYNPAVVGSVKRGDMARVVAEIAEARTFYNGQDCGAPDAILVKQSEVGAFIEELTAWLAAHNGGAMVPVHDSTKWGVACKFIDKHRARDPGSIVAGGGFGFDEGSQQAMMQPTAIVDSLEAALALGGQQDISFRASASRLFHEFYAPLFLILTVENDDNLELYFRHPAYALKAMYVSVFGKSAYVSAHIPQGQVLVETTLVSRDHWSMRYGGPGQEASGVLYGDLEARGMAINVMEQIARHALVERMHDKVDVRERLVAQVEPDVRRRQVEDAFASLLAEVDDAVREAKPHRDFGPRPRISAFAYQRTIPETSVPYQPFFVLMVCHGVSTRVVRAITAQRATSRMALLPGDRISSPYAPPRAKRTFPRDEPAGSAGAEHDDRCIPLAQHEALRGKLADWRPDGPSGYSDSDGVAGVLARVSGTHPYACSSTVYVTKDELQSLAKLSERSPCALLDDRELLLLGAFGRQSTRLESCFYPKRERKCRGKTIPSRDQTLWERLDRSVDQYIDGNRMRRARQSMFTAFFEAVNTGLRQLPDLPAQAEVGVSAFVYQVRQDRSTHAPEPVHVVVVCHDVPTKAVAIAMAKQAAEVVAAARQGAPEERKSDTTVGLAGLLMQQQGPSCTWPEPSTTFVADSELKDLRARAYSGADGPLTIAQARILAAFGPRVKRDGECVYCSQPKLRSQQQSLWRAMDAVAELASSAIDRWRADDRYAEAAPDNFAPPTSS